MKTKVGDIFTIDVSDGKVGLGRIIFKPKYQLFIVVFENIFDKNALPNVNDIVSLKPLLMGYTLDGLLYSGDWKVTGNNKDNLSKYPLPFYKLGTPPEVFLVDYTGTVKREATKSEMENLYYQTTLAPIYYEEALKAWHKIITWDKQYEEILFDEIVRKRAIVEF